MASPISGTFAVASYNGTAIDGDPQHVGEGLFASLDYDNFILTLVNYWAIPGDANGDRTVDAADFAIWEENRFSAGTDWTTGDFNGDGFTDGGDLLIWNANKFATVTTAVPEPQALVLIAWAAWGLLIRTGRLRRT